MNNIYKGERRMIIDEKGKLFGKVSIIDVCILVVIVAAIIFVGIRFMPGKEGTTSDSKLTVTYYAEEVSDFVANSVKVGDALMDDTRNCALGTVTNVEVMPSQSYATNSDGIYVKSSKEGFNSILITSETNGQLSDTGCIISNNRYGIGHSMTLRCGKAKIWIRVHGYDKK